MSLTSPSLVFEPSALVPPAGQEKPFLDSGQEYKFYAGVTGEKILTSNWMAEQVTGVAGELEARALPNETFNYFEAGLGNGLVTAGLVKGVHEKYPERGITVVAKEFSGDHVNEGLENLAEIFAAQQNFAFAVTNSLWPDAPTLRIQAPQDGVSRKPLIVKNVELQGNTVQEFREQVAALKDFVSEAWATRKNDKGAEVPANQAVLVVSRADRNEQLQPVPHVNDHGRTYHAVGVLHAWRLATPASTKANMLVPLSLALEPGIGKLFAVQASGGNSGEEIIESIWEESPFTGWDGIVEATQAKLGPNSAQFTFTEGRPLEMRASALTPQEAFRASVYAAQVPADQVAAALQEGTALEETRRVLAAHQGTLTFNNQTLVISHVADPAIWIETAFQTVHNAWKKPWGFIFRAFSCHNPDMAARNPLEPLNRYFEPPGHTPGYGPAAEEMPPGLPQTPTTDEKKGWLLGASARTFPKAPPAFAERQKRGWLIRDEVQADTPPGEPNTPAH